jgi:hypothetical protein
MRPAPIIAAVVFAAAVAVTGCTAHATADHPAAAPETPAAAPPVTPAPTPPTPAATPPVLAPKQPTPAPQPPVLTDGRYDAYLRQVNTRGDYLVVDLVQVFHDQAAVDAAIADGKPGGTAQYLSTYVRNHNPRLRTLPLAGDLRVDLLGGCEEPVSHTLSKLAADARTGGYYFTLTVSGGAVHRIQEHIEGNAC